MGFLKYLKLFGMFKNVDEAYKAETGKDRPAYLSRRFIGSVIVIVGAILAIEVGVKIDQTTLDSITDNLDKIISAVMVLYGLIMGIIGIVKRKKPE